MRVLRIAGIVLWRETNSIALPDEACSHLGDITIQQYDEQFPRWAQIGAIAGATRRLGAPQGNRASETPFHSDPRHQRMRYYWLLAGCVLVSGAAYAAWAYLLRG